MATKFSQSVNIIRDESKSLDYVSTPNAEKVALQIADEFKKGIHSFTLIGSYGTGKSSFLWAFEKSLKNEADFLPANTGLDPSKTNFLKIVGAYQSITEHFREVLGLKKEDPANRNILDTLNQEYEKTSSLVLYIDEFGKFLEYAAKNNPDKELYFLQQLAELVNDQSKDILFLTTLHQNFEAYGNKLKDQERLEWKKIKGRFKEITFNEPVEQLLWLAAKKLASGKTPKSFSGSFYSDLAAKHNIKDFSEEFRSVIENEIYPLDVISGMVLTLALQRYGQNERSLFGFLELEAAESQRMALPAVFDYLFKNFYSSLQSNTNPHYGSWRMMERGIERAEFELDDPATAIDLIKATGLLQVFVPTAKIDEKFLKGYFKESLSAKKIIQAIDQLSKRKIIVYTRYNQSFKLIEGTDLDFDQAILKAGEAVDEIRNLVPLLEEYFEFPVMQAKEVSYKTGTPRLFDFQITEKPLVNYTPEGPFDGAVNLIFSESLKEVEIESASTEQEEPIVYGFFKNTSEIKDSLFELLKTRKVLAENSDDIVARRELEVIIKSRQSLLQHQVMDAMYSGKVSWIYNGKKRNEVKSSRSFNKLLSEVCEEAYSKSPRFINELVNKDKISSSIHTARKNYFKQIVNHWREKDLGFEEDKFPPEKTIYFTLLKENGMHFKAKSGFELQAPNDKNGFNHLWNASDEFLKSTVDQKMSITKLAELLSTRPYKIKQGLIDFWIPTFLFVKRAEFALYNKDRFVPHLNDAVLYMMTRNPQDYSIKAFQIQGIRLTVFNKYRELLEQAEKPKLSNGAFIESIRPFLVFYKELTEYSKNTNRLDSTTIELRKAITNASDPEKTFFEDFPAALGMSIEQMDDNEKLVQEFFTKVNDSIDELKDAYSNLVERIDLYLRNEIIGTTKVFPGYKKELQKRFKNVKEHRLLPKQKVFLQRLQSTLDDRDSWIASIAHAVLGKPLDRIKDEEEELLKDQLSRMIQELQNLSSIHHSQKADDEEFVKLDITTTSEGLTENNIRIPKGKKKEIDSLVEELRGKLDNNKQLKLAVLARLLKDELHGKG
ncbi:hypothetical protein [Salibacter halophilus]|uniref:ATP-binding protein n=1 Tax=Salibacter halophilus TaxID=1803916 RepID=A0A6N6MB04_9FLAO|nr:hypothetical protein [Salibacter halophilus]KAB1065611.1 hypothetical protein F3059_02860 [Salibacter halophilus]